jgi:hypothetical protein
VTPVAAGLSDASVVPAALAGRPAPAVRLRHAGDATLDTASLAGTPHVAFLGSDLAYDLRALV